MTQSRPADARRHLAQIIERTFPEPSQLRDFLSQHGYDEVVRAIPESEHASYCRELIIALDRRGRLDAQFFAVLIRERPDDALRIEQAAEALGVRLRANEAIAEPQAANAVAPSGEGRPAPARPPRPGATRGVTLWKAPRTRGRPAAPSPHLWLPHDRVEAVRSVLGVVDPAALTIISFGSPWRDLLVGSADAPESMADVVERLARDPRDDARTALFWMLQRLVEGLEIDSKALDVVAAARDLVAPAVEKETAADQPLETTFPFREETVPFSYLREGIDAGRAVARIRLSGESRRAGGGSGWLLTPSLVVIPSHMFTFAVQVQSLRFDEELVRRVFSTAEVDLDFDGDNAQPRTVRAEQLAFFDPGLDLALLRLNEPVTDRAPMSVAVEPVKAGYAPIALIHHPQLGPKHISFEGGRVLAHDGHQMTYLLATLPGSAGGPVMDERWRVLATHTSFRLFRRNTTEAPINAKTGTASTALLKRLREPSHAPLFREVVAAQPAFRTIDRTIHQQLADARRKADAPAKVSFVIDVLHETTPLHGIPDLQIRSRRGTLVTALGSSRSLDALEQLPDVVSVNASLRGGATECWDSVPHIGAVKVHVPEIATRKIEMGDAALVGVIDTGIDVLHEAFRDEHGRSRIVAFWDQRDTQSVAPDAPLKARGFSPAGEAAVTRFNLGYGTLYLQADIQRFIDGEPLPESFPPLSRMQHGTTVCSIAAGRRTGADPDVHFGGGVAPAAGLIVVRFDLRDATIGYNTGHVDALSFIDQLAASVGRPVVVNISNGMNTGAHDGSSDVERMCETFLKNGSAPGRVIVKSAGNERRQKRHASLDVAEGGVGTLRWRSAPVRRVEPEEEAPDEILELWFDSANAYRFRVKPPHGAASPWVEDRPDFDHLTERLENLNVVHANLNRLHPSGNGMFRLTILPGDASSVESGDWQLDVEGGNVPVAKPIHAWVERMANRDLRFADHETDAITITIPGTSSNVIVVGAVEIGDKMRPHAQSSQGPTRGGAIVEKPDLVAPGVRIRAAQVATGVKGDPVPLPDVEGNSGTSFAAPHVTGAVALLLSAAAKNPARPQFNALQVRNALLASARHFRGQWNADTGFGEVNIDSLFSMYKL